VPRYGGEKEGMDAEGRVSHLVWYSKTGASAPRYVILVFFRRPDGDHAAGAKRGDTTAQASEFRGVLRVISLVLRGRKFRSRSNSWHRVVVVVFVVIVVGSTVS
jgi:hypothetical protein